METVLVMCPQNSYLSPTGTVYMGERAEILKIRLIDFLKDFKGKRVFFREKRSLEDTIFANDKTHSLAASDDFHVESSLKEYADLFFDKIRHSAFFGTKLEEHLVREKVNSVFLVGLETHTSILFTAEELRNRKIDVTIIEPLIMSRDQYMHSCAVSIMIHCLGIKVGS